MSDTTARCVALYTSGATLEQTAREVGLHYTSVRMRLLGAGVVMRPSGKRRIPYTTAQQHLDAGLSQAETARRLGVTKAAICQAIGRGTLRKRVMA